MVEIVEIVKGCNLGFLCLALGSYLEFIIPLFLEQYVFSSTVHFHKPTWKLFSYTCQMVKQTLRIYCGIIEYQNKKRSNKSMSQTAGPHWCLIKKKKVKQAGFILQWSLKYMTALPIYTHGRVFFISRDILKSLS